MPDLSPELLPSLQEHRLPGLDLSPGYIYPNYAGGSILNLPNAFCRLLGAPPLRENRELRPEIMEPMRALAEGCQTVIYILMDALALHRLRKWIAEGQAPFWAQLSEDGFLAPLTSISPSTTSTALPTLWSGLSPAEHGMVGYELWLKEYGVVANMITHSPFQVRGDLQEAGFKAEKALAGPTLGTRFSEYGIETTAFQHYTIAASGMSRMFLMNTDIHGFGSPVDVMASMRQKIESGHEKKRFIAVYWGEVDHYSHNFGPDDDRPAFEFEHFTTAFKRYFVDELSPAQRNKILVILGADHGQILTPKDPHYDLKSHPGLSRRLALNPTGENRLIYFNIRPGQVEAVREYLDRKFLGQFKQMNPDYAISSGLFGPGEPHPRLRDRIGDLVAAPEGQAYLWWGEKESPIIGRHGGLTAEEMLVPLVVGRL